jgi:hypothetical protein
MGAASGQISLASIAVALVLVSLPAVAFDRDEFCTTVSRGSTA